MATRDLTLEVLKDIRADIKETNLRLQGVEHGLGTMQRQIVESEVRTATALTDLASTVRDLTTLLRN